MRPKTKGRSSEFSQALAALVILGLFRVRDVISECLQSGGEMRKAFSHSAFLLNETHTVDHMGEAGGPRVALEGYRVIHSQACVHVGGTFNSASTDPRKREV